MLVGWNIRNSIVARIWLIDEEPRFSDIAVVLWELNANATSRAFSLTDEHQVVQFVDCCAQWQFSINPTTRFPFFQLVLDGVEVLSAESRNLWFQREWNSSPCQTIVEFQLTSSCIVPERTSRHCRRIDFIDVSNKRNPRSTVPLQPGIANV
ncbi:hypothetical protein D3C75_793590 [compost metagenome]